MNIDDMTYGELKHIAAMFAPDQAKQCSAVSPMLGKFVVVRCRDAGVHAGVLESSDGRACTLTEARRLWYWKVKGGGDFLHAIALAGVHEDSKLSAAIERITLTENCEILQCTTESEASIRAQAVHNG